MAKDLTTNPGLLYEAREQVFGPERGVAKGERTLLRQRVRVLGSRRKRTAGLAVRAGRRGWDCRLDRRAQLLRIDPEILQHGCSDASVEPEQGQCQVLRADVLVVQPGALGYGSL